MTIITKTLSLQKQRQDSYPIVIKTVQNRMARLLTIAELNETVYSAYYIGYKLYILDLGLGLGLG